MMKRQRSKCAGDQLMEEEHPCRGSPWGKGPGVESACVQEWQKEGKQRAFPGG